MDNWRDDILKEFVADVHAITAAADPDGLLTEPLLSQSLDGKGVRRPQVRRGQHA